MKLTLIQGGLDDDEHILMMKLKKYAKGCKQAGTDMDTTTILMICSEHPDAWDRLMEKKTPVKLLPNLTITLHLKE